MLEIGGNFGSSNLLAENKIETDILFKAIYTILVRRAEEAKYVYWNKEMNG